MARTSAEACAACANEGASLASAMSAARDSPSRSPPSSHIGREELLKKLQQAMAKYGAKKQSGEEDASQPTGASKPYKPPPKPEARAPTVPKAPGAARAAKPRVEGGGAGVHARADPSMARLEAEALGDGSALEQLAEKDQQLSEALETVQILEVKISKLEQLVRLKDSKIATLQAKLAQAGL